MEAEPLPEGEGAKIPGIDDEDPIEDFNDSVEEHLEANLESIPLSMFAEEFGSSLVSDLEKANVPERMSSSLSNDFKAKVQEQSIGPDTPQQRGMQKATAKGLLDNQDVIKDNATSNLHDIASSPDDIRNLEPEQIDNATGDAVNEYTEAQGKQWSKDIANSMDSGFDEEAKNNNVDPNDPDAKEYKEQLKKKASDQIDPKNRAKNAKAMDNAETPGTPENEGANGVKDDIEKETYGEKVKEWFKENWGKALGLSLGFLLFLKMMLGGENPLDPNNWLKALESLAKGLVNTILNLLKKLWEVFYNNIVKPVGKLLGKVIWYILAAIAVLIVIGLIVKFTFSRIGKGKDKRGKVIGKVYAT